MNRFIGKNDYIMALDIGSTKICCLIAKIHTDGRMQIVADGYAQSKGITNGNITQINDAVPAIQDAICSAENKIDKRIHNVVVNVSSPAMKSNFATATIEMDDAHTITSSDVRRLIDTAVTSIDLKGQEIIHQIPLSFVLDGQGNITQPVGLSGNKLSVTMLIISVPLGQIKMLSAALERCHLNVVGKVATPYASALAVLSEEEKQMGATVLDLGGDNTGIAIFSNGYLRYADNLKLGGSLITKDLSQILKIPFFQAEKIKTLYGRAFLSPQDSDVEIPDTTSADDENPILQSHIIEIMIPRIEEMIELTQSRLSYLEGSDFATRYILMTGGSSQIRGLSEKTASILQARVKIAKPLTLNEKIDTSLANSFACATGLLRYFANRRIQMEENQTNTNINGNGYIKRIIRWLKQSF